MKIAIVVLFIVGVILWEVASWQECLATQSWWYCLRILGQ